VLKGKSNTPPSTTASCGLGKGEEVKTERKRENIEVALAVPVLQCKNTAVEGKWSLSSSFLSSGLAQGKSTENLPSHIRPPASCARGEMPPAFLGIMVGRIFL